MRFVISQRPDVAIAWAMVLMLVRLERRLPSVGHVRAALASYAHPRTNYGVH